MCGSSAASRRRGSSSVQIGEVVEGRIQAVKPYGAFVDLGGGLSGLLHISEISHDRIQNVDSVLGEGDLIKVGLD